MNEIKIYPTRWQYWLILLISILCVVMAIYFAINKLDSDKLIYSLLVCGLGLMIGTLVQLFRYKPKITITLHGIQFHYVINVKGEPVINQFVAWNDIQQIQLNGKKISLDVDDNPPDYEKLNELELANLPKREMVLAHLTASVAGLSVSAQKLANWLGQMKQAKNQERNSLILSFHYEK